MTKLAVVGGDGIGPEVTEAAVLVLEAAAVRFGVALSMDRWDLGAERFLREGVTITDREMDRLTSEHALALLGALGDPRVPGNEHARDILLGLRRRADLFVNLRPCRLRLPSLCPLKDPGGPVDIVIFRENTEGLYAGLGGRFKPGTSDEIATQESVNTYKGVERIVRAAFDYAGSNGRERVTLVDKANALVHEGCLWRRVFAEVGSRFPGVEQEVQYVDATAMEMVRRPARYDVIVTSNLFGDIVSDLAAQVTGGLGLAPSANLHPGAWALFEPVHGSAPDIAGTGKANPAGAIACGGLIFEHLNQPDAAAAVENALLASFRAGVATPDLNGRATTHEVGEWVAAHILEEKCA